VERWEQGRVDVDMTSSYLGSKHLRLAAKPALEGKEMNGDHSLARVAICETLFKNK
jgi:hypothetical protein